MIRQQQQSIRMDILEICPPKNLVFSIPTDLQRILTITNLTLRSLYVHILRSHPYQLSVSRQWALMSAFEQLKIQVGLNFNQDIQNISEAKLRVYYYETDEQEDEQAMRRRAFSPDNKTQFEEICIQYDIHATTLNYQQVQLNEQKKYQPICLQASSKSYVMRRVYPQRTNSPALTPILIGDRLKNEIFNYLQHLNYVASIQECENNFAFLIEFKQGQQEVCDFVTFTIQDTTIVFSLAKIISYGKSYNIPTLVSIDSDDQPTAVTKIIEKEVPPLLLKKQSPVKEKQIKNDPVVSQQKVQEAGDRKKKQLTKQSFAVKREGDRIRTKRRNKSQQKIKEISEQSDQQQGQARKQFQNMRLGINFDMHPPPPPPPIKIRHQVKINETNIELPQKVLAVIIELKFNFHYIYVIVRDCVRVFIMEDPSFKRVIKFDAIDSQHVNMPTPADIYNDQLIFGNQSYLFWVNLTSGQSEWKYVQRKYIYALAVIQQLSLIALGGKNFSKLSYFGKETSRSNLKLYSCTANDKHDHLFTYDFPGTNVGHVVSMAYITTPPLATKLLLVHTVAPDARSTLFFLRVKAFNKIEVYGQLQLDELGILNLLKFKYNRDTGRVICLQALGDTEMDTFKRLKIKCQYEKVEVSTQGLKLPLKRFTSFHLGGSKEGVAREWMSFVQQNGCVFHLYDFESNKMDTYQLGKGEIRQVFSLYNGKYLIICSDTAVRIRQKVEIQIKQ